MRYHNLPISTRPYADGFNLHRFCGSSAYLGGFTKMARLKPYSQRNAVLMSILPNGMHTDQSGIRRTWKALDLRTGKHCVSRCVLHRDGPTIRYATSWNRSPCVYIQYEIQLYWLLQWQKSASQVRLHPPKPICCTHDCMHPTLLVGVINVNG